MYKACVPASLVTFAAYVSTVRYSHHQITSPGLMQQLVGRQATSRKPPADQRRLAPVSSSPLFVHLGMVCSAKGQPNMFSGCSETDSEASTSGQTREEQNAMLVGTVELSFAASTRARYLTLNAPVVSSYTTLQSACTG